MSSTFLKLISVQPNYVPGVQAIEAGKLYLHKMLPGSEIEFVTTDSIEFIDQGSNFDSVICNLCKRTIEIDFWQEKMDKAFENHFTDLSFKTKCCHKTTSLNDLEYKSAAGFARFVVSINDAKKDIDPKNREQLEKVLGTELRTIWARY